MGKAQRKLDEGFEIPIASDIEVGDDSSFNRLFMQTKVKVKQRLIDADYLKVIEWQRRPELFLRDVLNFDPWLCEDSDDQMDILYAVRDNPRVTVKSGNGNGKTAIAARIVLWFLSCFYPSKVITTAPTTRQVEKLLWGELRSSYKSANINFGGELLNTELRFSDEWFALGFATDEPEKFQGFHAPYMLVVVDEASGVPESIFQAIEGILTNQNARVLLIGNPTDPASYFGRTHLHPREAKGWKHLHLNCWNSPNVKKGRVLIPALCAPQWPNDKLKQWGEFNPFYQVRVLGNFPAIGEDTLIPYHLVHSALERSIKGEGEKVLAVDVARFGHDASVIARLWGSNHRIMHKLHKQDGNLLADNVIRVLKTENKKVDTTSSNNVKDKVTKIKVDIIGWGASCFDALTKMKRKGTDEEKLLLKDVALIPVNVSENPKSGPAQKDYANIRAEAAFMVRDMFESGDIDIIDEDLAVQAANIKYDFTGGKYILEKKKAYKTRMGSSPDEFDTMIIAKAITEGFTPHLW